MNELIEKFSLTISYDSNLKEIAEDLNEFKKAVQYLLNKNNQSLIEIEKAKYQSFLGYCFKILGEYELSIDNLTLASEIFLIKNLKFEYLQAQLRLVQSLQYNTSIISALKIIDLLELFINENDELNEYLDFFYQHKAKLFFEMKNFELAKKFFEKALKIRNQKGNLELIKSSKFALNKVNILLNLK